MKTEYISDDGTVRSVRMFDVQRYEAEQEGLIALPWHTETHPCGDKQRIRDARGRYPHVDGWSSELRDVCDLVNLLPAAVQFLRFVSFHGVSESELEEYGIKDARTAIVNWHREYERLTGRQR